MPDKTFAEHLLSSAIARSLGTQTHSTLPGHGAGLPEHPQEMVIIETVKKILDELPRKTPVPAASTEGVAETGPPTPGAVAEGVRDGTTESGAKEEVHNQERKAAKDVVPPTEKSADAQTSGVAEQDATRSSERVTIAMETTPAPVTDAYPAQGRRP